MDFLKQIKQVASQFGDMLTDEMRAHLELGAALIEKADYDGALHELLQALRKKPDHAQALFLLGLCYFRRNQEGDLLLAEQHLTASVQANPRGADPYLYLGQIRAQVGSLEEAIPLFQKGLVLADSSLRPHFHRRLGQIYARNGMPHKAIRELRKVMTSFESDSESLRLLIELLLTQESFTSFKDSWLFQDLSKACAQVLEIHPFDGPLWSSLGLLFLQIGDLSQSDHAFASALRLLEETPTAFLEHAKWLLSHRAIKAAMDAAQKALFVFQEKPVLDSQVASLFALLATCQSQLGQHEDALLSYRKAISSFPKDAKIESALVSDAIRCAIACHDEALAQQWACLPADDLSPWALSVRSRDPSLDISQAKAMLEQARVLDALMDCDEILFSQSILRKKEGLESEAIALLLHFVKRNPLDQRPCLLIKDWRLPSAFLSANTFADLLDAMTLFLTETKEYQAYLPAWHQICARYHAPLTIAIMGEFNAGKSTLINALLGQEVVPMGLTPTTSVISVFTYAPAPSLSLCAQDGTKTVLDWNQRESLFLGTSSLQVSSESFVQVGYPLDLLKDVKLVDTPGLNSIVPEHQEISQAFLPNVDALLWIFSADQAGKATEQAVLSQIHAHGIDSAIAVLNKIDRYPKDLEKSGDSPVQIIVKHIQRQNPKEIHFQDILPVSAKQALLASSSFDSALHAASHLPKLQAAIFEHFVSQKKAIKTRIAQRQISPFLSLLKQQAKQELLPIEYHLLSMETKPDWDPKTRAAEIVAQERKNLIVDVASLHQALALELIECAKPRSWLLGDNASTSADRQFLEDWAQIKCRQLASASSARVKDQLPEFGNSLGFVLSQHVYNPYVMFAKGFLLGGWLDIFFQNILPKMELTEFEVTRMLDRGFPTALESLERFLLRPLQDVLSNHLFEYQKNMQARLGLALFQQADETSRLWLPLLAWESRRSAVD